MFTTMHPQLDGKELLSLVENLDIKALLDGGKKNFPRSAELVANIENLCGLIGNHLYVDLINNVKFLVK